MRRPYLLEWILIEVHAPLVWSVALAGTDDLNLSYTAIFSRPCLGNRPTVSWQM